MFVTYKQYKDLKELSDHRAERIEYLEKRLEDLELEVAWSTGEIDFWQIECEKAEAKLKVKCKPWWRYVIS